MAENYGLITAGRDRQGRFVKGNREAAKHHSGGRRPLVIKTLLDMAVTEAEWLAIFQEAKRMALAGDIRAAKFLVDARFGKPPQDVELSGPGGGPLDIGLIISELERRRIEGTH